MLFAASLSRRAVSPGRGLALARSFSAGGNPTVFLDMSIGGEDVRRITMELRADAAPKTAENFRQLCTGEAGTGNSGKPLHFKGTGGESIYGNKFEDEDFSLKHEGEGVLSMANAGPNTNGSQFFLTLVDCAWLDGKHVVFGKVTDGMDVVKQIEGMGSSNGQTIKEVKIEDCGELTE